MGRRRKCRIVSIAPEVTVFKPQGVPMAQLQGVALLLDELEAMRLVDAEGLNQEDAATFMQVSRPTLCRTLGQARAKVARALSRGWAIRIETDSPEFNSQDKKTMACQGRGQGRGCGAHEQQGGRSCQDVQDKVAVEEAKVDAAKVAVARVAEAATDSGRDPGSAQAAAAGPEEV